MMYLEEFTVVFVVKWVGGAGGLFSYGAGVQGESGGGGSRWEELFFLFARVVRPAYTAGLRTAGQSIDMP